MSKRYHVGGRDVVALDRVDLHVDESAFVVILGPRRGAGSTRRCWLFGVPVRGLMGVITSEAVTVGLPATVVGTASGMPMLQWILDPLASKRLPDFDIARAISRPPWRARSRWAWCR